jgi:simple sugar transport system permease protein
MLMFLTYIAVRSMAYSMSQSFMALYLVDDRGFSGTLTSTLIGLNTLVGIAGASYSLNIKIGWAEGSTRGFGWIALAIVIFGGWSPVRGMLGALLFGATKALATYLQRTYPEVSVVAFNAIPWVLMILVLLLVGSDFTERMILIAPKSIQRPLQRILRIAPPAALGSSFIED